MRSLTLFIDAHDPDPPEGHLCPWTQVLYVLQQGLPAPARLEALTISMRLAHPGPEDLDGAISWGVLETLGEMLVSGEYAAVQTVEFVVEWTAWPSWDLRDEANALMRKIRRRLSKLSDTGRLVVRYGVLREVRVPSLYRSCVVLTKGLPVSMLISCTRISMCIW